MDEVSSGLKTGDFLKSFYVLITSVSCFSNSWPKVGSKNEKLPNIILLLYKERGKSIAIRK